MSLMGLAATYVLLGLLGLLILLRLNFPLWLKFVVILMMSGGYLLHYGTLKSFLGWPSTDALPMQFEIIATDVQEPSVTRDNVAAIHFWVRSATHRDEAPKAYTQPYSKALHQKVIEINKALKSGKRQFGRRSGDQVGGGGKGEFFLPSRQALPAKTESRPQ
jgi:hypothetical protein